MMDDKVVGHKFWKSFLKHFFMLKKNKCAYTIKKCLESILWQQCLGEKVFQGTAAVRPHQGVCPSALGIGDRKDKTRQD